MQYTLTSLRACVNGVNAPQNDAYSCHRSVFLYSPSCRRLTQSVWCFRDKFCKCPRTINKHTDRPPLSYYYYRISAVVSTNTLCIRILPSHPIANSYSDILKLPARVPKHVLTDLPNCIVNNPDLTVRAKTYLQLCH